MSEPTSLRKIGQETANSFSILTNELSRTTSRFKGQLSTARCALQGERLTLWASTLGLFHAGHASLDYRLRDADIVRCYVADVLRELSAYLLDIIDIITLVRPPAEDEAAVAQHSGEEDNTTRSGEEDSANTADEAGAQEKSTQYDDESDDSDGPFQEVSFRFEAIVERVNGLYNLATKIRNPTTRPQRSTADLFKRDPELLEEREMIETSVVKYMHGQYLMRTSVEPVNDSDTETSTADGNLWLLERIGKANARRSQQFVYWKEHAERLAAPPVSVEQPVLHLEAPATVAVDSPSPATAVSSIVPQDTQHYSEDPTTATRLDPEQVKLDDEVSMMSSFVSRVSTMRGFGVGKLNWPLPPKGLEQDGFFNCPYCKTICPARYLRDDTWKKHLVNDLQPYQCTYEDCVEPERLYGSKAEWIRHEGMSHARVWHCAEHPEDEFWTQSGYVEHMRHDIHTTDTTALQAPELIAACVGPSKFVQRTCPICNVGVAALSDLQSHLASHLERFALLALPKLTDFDEDGGEEFHDSSQSLSAHAQVQKRFDDDSRLDDFDWDETLNFMDEDQDTIHQRLPTNSNEVLQEIIDLLNPSSSDHMSLRAGRAREMTRRDVPDVDTLLQKLRSAELLQARDACKAIAAMAEVRMNHYKDAEDRVSLPPIDLHEPTTDLNEPIWLHEPPFHVGYMSAMSGRLPGTLSKEELDNRLNQWFSSVLVIPEEMGKYPEVATLLDTYKVPEYAPRSPEYPPSPDYPRPLSPRRSYGAPELLYPDEMGDEYLDDGYDDDAIPMPIPLPTREQQRHMPGSFYNTATSASKQARDTSRRRRGA